MFNGWFNDRRPARRVTLKGLHHRTQRPEAHVSRVARVACVARVAGLRFQGLHLAKGAHVISTYPWYLSGQMENYET